MKICPLLLQHDYGLAGRGISLEKKIFLPALKRIFDECVPFWLEDHGFGTDLNLLQENILKFVKKEKPDVVFMVLMDYEIQIRTLDAMRAMGVKVINFFCDTTWRWEWVKLIAPHLDYAFDTDMFSIANYEGICKAIHCQWGSYPVEITTETKLLKYDISFIGGKNPAREWWVEALLPEYKVECFGHGWPNGVCDMSRVIPYTKINLNLSNSVPKDLRFWQSPYSQQPQSGKVVEQIKLRHFEIPSYGGFQLAHHAAGTPEGIVTYSDIDDLKRLIKYYLVNPRPIYKPDSFEANLFKAFSYCNVGIFRLA